MKNKKQISGRFNDETADKIIGYCKKNNITINQFILNAVDSFFNKEFSKTDYQTLLIDKLFILNYMQILQISGDKNAEKYNDMAVKKLQEIKDEFNNLKGGINEKRH
jgi:hypothetical protein